MTDKPDRRITRRAALSATSVGTAGWLMGASGLARAEDDTESAITWSRTIAGRLRLAGHGWTCDPDEVQSDGNLPGCSRNVCQSQSSKGSSRQDRASSSLTDRSYGT